MIVNITLIEVGFDFDCVGGLKAELPKVGTRIVLGLAPIHTMNIGLFGDSPTLGYIHLKIC